MLFAIFAFTNAFAEATLTNVLTIQDGPIQGIVYSNGVRGYLGIPYAASTEGENRWQAPQKVEAWTEVRDCTDFGLIAPQGEAFNWTGAYTDEYLTVGKTIDNGTMSEDCLSLNVWTKAAEGDALPVIVYIHGGGNNSGASTDEIYSGEKIAEKNVVWVSINYRVGIFGFLAYQDSTGEEVTGNYAILDQIAALLWVQDNIEKFGGDPSNVTIMGQSAGSMDCQMLMISPKAAGLFQHAACLSAYIADQPIVTKEELEAQASEIIGDYTISDLRQMSMQEMEAFAETTYNPATYCIDGEILVADIRESFASGNYNKVDFMTGGVSGDLSTFASYLPLQLPDDDGNPFTPVTFITAEGYADALKACFCEMAEEMHAVYKEDPSEENAYPVAEKLNTDGLIADHFYNGYIRDLNDSGHQSYVYFFTHAIPDAENELGVFGAFHTADVSYWNNYYSTVSGKKWTEYDYQLGDMMSDYLVNFAATGNPNGEGLPEWKAVDPFDDIGYMSFGDEMSEYVLFDEATSNLWKKQQGIAGEAE